MRQGKHLFLRQSGKEVVEPEAAFQGEACAPRAFLIAHRSLLYAYYQAKVNLVWTVIS
jgi:hypothetical protein